MNRGGWAALTGVTAAAVALGVAEVVAVLTGPRTAPLVAVGGVVVDTVPEPVKSWAIDVFGVYDKVALLVGTSVLLAAFAALVGVLARRDIRLGYVGVALFGLLSTIAALTRPGAGPVAMLPSVVAAAAAAGVLWALLAGPLRLIDPEPAAPGAVPSDPGPPGPATDPGPLAPPLGQAGGAVRRGLRRRQFGTVLGATLGGAAIVGGAGRTLGQRRDVLAARDAVLLPAPGQPAAPIPAGADLNLSGLARYVTPNRDFYRIDTALVVPRVDPRTWKLSVTGRVRTPVTLSFDDLMRRPMVERHITLACVSNTVGGDLIGNAKWLGVPVREVLAAAGPLDGADQVVSRSVDGWTCGTPTAALLDGRDALLAVAMNGEALPIEHGFPVRMVVPGLYGYVSACKWLVELELTSFDDFDAYWVPRGWAAQAPIKTQSRIDTPRLGAEVSAGAVTVAGVAWAQRRGIARVEVRVDDGPWQSATLADTVSLDTWRQWSWRWDATPGEHTLAVRATDATGDTQTGTRAPVAPDGATGWHTIRVSVSA